MNWKNVRRWIMRFPRMLAVAAVGAIALAACGSSGYKSGSHAAPAAAAQPAAQAARVAVMTGKTALGTVLVDGNGLTLYGRTTDTNGMSSCTGSCASVWP